MKKFIIITDVQSDLSKDLRERFDIEYIKGHLTTPDGKEHEGLLEWDGFEKKEFFSGLKNKSNTYTTSPASPEEYKEKFLEFTKQGFDVLSISISSKLSGSYDFACQGRDLALAEAKDSKIICIDSKKYSNGIALMAINASILRSEGKSIDEVAKWLEDHSRNIHQTGWLDDLSFVASKGRISHPAAFFGQLIGIKPLADFNPDGLVTVIGKAKGEKQAYKVIIDYIKAEIENPQDQIILIAETNRYEKALKLKELIETEIKPKEVVLTEVFPSSAINVGPGLNAAYFLGKYTSDDLVEETKLLTSLLEK